MLISTSRTQQLHGIVGHRGSLKAPENTMSAFKQAYADGADAVELDILRTKDGHYVVMHDDAVDRTTNGHGLVEDLTLEEIQKLDAGSWKDPKFTGEKAPELGEVLDWAKGKLRVLIEVKRESAAKSSGQELVDIIREKGVSDQVTVMSFNRPFVERVEKLAPDLDTGVLSAPYTAYKTAGVGAALGLAGGLVGGLMASGNPLVTVATTLAGAVGGALVGRYLGMGQNRDDAANTTADNVMPNWFVATPKFLDIAHDHNKNVIPYTVDNPIVAGVVKRNGVDGLITNKPENYAKPRG